MFARLVTIARAPANQKEQEPLDLISSYIPTALLLLVYKNHGCHKAKGSPTTIASWLLAICSVVNRSTLELSLVGPLPLHRILQELLSTWDVKGPLSFMLTHVDCLSGSMVH